MRSSPFLGSAQLPALEFPPELLLKAQAVRLAFFDLSVLAPQGLAHKHQQDDALAALSSQDLLGLELLKDVGIAAVFIDRPGRANMGRPIREGEALSLGLRLVDADPHDRAVLAGQILHNEGLCWQQAAAMGSDWPDMALMQRAVVSAAPSDAHAELRARADFLSAAPSGRGAVRSFVDLLLVARGQYAGLLKRFFS